MRLGYGLGDLGLVSGKDTAHSLLHSIQTVCGAKPISCTLGTGGSFEPWHYPLASIQCRGWVYWNYTWTVPKRFMTCCLISWAHGLLIGPALIMCSFRSSALGIWEKCGIVFRRFLNTKIVFCYDSTISSIDFISLHQIFCNELFKVKNILLYYIFDICLIYFNIILFLLVSNSFV
jgi:hypothetical protein